MLPCVWTETALAELTEIRQYVALDSEIKASEVALRIVMATELLCKSPQIGKLGRVPGTREFLVPRTKYILVYRVEAERIEVIAVFRGARNWGVTAS